MTAHAWREGGREGRGGGHGVAGGARGGAPCGGPPRWMQSRRGGCSPAEVDAVEERACAQAHVRSENWSRVSGKRARATVRMCARACGCARAAAAHLLHLRRLVVHAAWWCAVGKRPPLHARGGLPPPAEAVAHDEATPEVGESSSIVGERASGAQYLSQLSRGGLAAGGIGTAGKASERVGTRSSDGLRVCGSRPTLGGDPEPRSTTSASFRARPALVS